MFGLGPLEVLVIVILAVLIFGKRLPEIGRSVGKSIVELKKGLAGIEDDLNKPNAYPQQPNAYQQPNQNQIAQQQPSASIPPAAPVQQQAAPQQQQQQAQAPSQQPPSGQN